MDSEELELTRYFVSMRHCTSCRPFTTQHVESATILATVTTPFWRTEYRGPITYHQGVMDEATEMVQTAYKHREELARLYGSSSKPEYSPPKYCNDCRTALSNGYYILVHSQKNDSELSEMVTRSWNKCYEDIINQKNEERRRKDEEERERERKRESNRKWQEKFAREREAQRKAAEEASRANIQRNKELRAKIQQVKPITEHAPLLKNNKNRGCGSCDCLSSIFSIFTN